MLCSTSEGTEPTALLCQRLQVSETRCVFKAEQDQWFQQALRRHLSECRCHWGGRWRSGTPSVLPSWGEAAIHIPQGEPRTESGCVAVSALLLNGVELTGFGKSFEETCSLTHGLPHTVSATNGQPPGSRGLCTGQLRRSDCRDSHWLSSTGRLTPSQLGYMLSTLTSAITTLNIFRPRYIKYTIEVSFVVKGTLSLIKEKSLCISSLFPSEANWYTICLLFYLISRVIK